MASAYNHLLSGIADVLIRARRQTAKAINSALTGTYWDIGRRIVLYEQAGKVRAAYGEALLTRLAQDLTRRLGRGFSERNLAQMRLFYLQWPISQTVSAKSDEPGTAIRRTLSGKSEFPGRPIGQTASAQSGPPSFPLSWSQYVLLISIENPQVRLFYQKESIRGGWSVRQLDRQIGSQYYERTLLSKNKAAMLSKGSECPSADRVTPEDELKDPYVLEFLDLKDEYSENDLEEALVRHIEHFLLELGVGFAFIGRQKRLRIGDAWYRVDLVLFHRRLKCLVLIDLKLGRFSHADAGQMHLYLNYARQHWTLAHENPPVGLILCTRKDETVAHYALEGLPNKVLASVYKTSLPVKSRLEAELRKTQRTLQLRRLKPQA